MISQIVAHSSNHVIGKDNKLPWHYPEDLKHFKNITTGKTIVMGRKTFESIGKPLPNRKNIVLTRNTDRSAEGIEVIYDTQDIIKKYKKNKEELMVIGGQQIYELFLPYTDKLYITQVHRKVEGDAFYPQYAEKFLETSRVTGDEYDSMEFERIKFGEPRVGIGVCITKDNKVLFGKRKGSHGEGTWQRPGGHLEGGEDRSTCAIRETMEEANIVIKNIKLMHVTNDVFKNESKHYITLLMKAEYKSGDVKNMEPHKLEKREWLDRNNLPDNLFLPIQNMINEGISPFN